MDLLKQGIIASVVDILTSLGVDVGVDISFALFIFMLIRSHEFLGCLVVSLVKGFCWVCILWSRLVIFPLSMYRAFIVHGVLW